MSLIAALVQELLKILFGGPKSPPSPPGGIGLSRFAENVQFIALFDTCQVN